MEDKIRVLTTGIPTDKTVAIMGHADDLVALGKRLQGNFSELTIHGVQKANQYYPVVLKGMIILADKSADARIRFVVEDQWLRIRGPVKAIHGVFGRSIEREFLNPRPGHHIHIDSLGCEDFIEDTGYFLIVEMDEA